MANMPYMSGFEFYEYVQKIAPSLADKTIVFTGSVNDEDTREFLTKNKLPYMAKTFDVEELKREVRQILKCKRPDVVDESEEKG